DSARGRGGPDKLPVRLVPASVEVCASSGQRQPCDLPRNGSRRSDVPISVRSGLGTASRDHLLSRPSYLYNRHVGCLPMTKKMELLRGTLEMLILKVVAPGPIHGYGISQRLKQMSSNVLDVRQGSLYPALHRMEKEGLVSAKWLDSDAGHQAKFY